MPPRWAKEGSLFQRLHLAALHPGPTLAGLAVEGAGDAEAEVLETAIAQQGGAQVADADQEGFGLVVPAEKAFDGNDEFADAEAEPRQCR